MRTPSHIVGPDLDAKDQCEAILRSVPQWFGIEEALLRYVADTAALPTFAVERGERLDGFLTLREHFPAGWEIHCMAVRADSRRHGHGRALMEHAETWLADRGAEVLQVKTIAMTKDHAQYAETREFYYSMGFQPLEIFPELWAPHNPCLQLVKFIRKPPQWRTAAQPMASELPEQDRQVLTRLEEAMWREETRFDPAFMERTLAPDFFEFGRSGRTYTRQEILAMPREPIDAELPLADFRIRQVDANTAQVTYNSKVRYHGVVEFGRRSSLWSRAGGAWVLRFHQGTAYVPSKTGG